MQAPYLTKPLSEELKARIADFYATVPEDAYWWHDPRYLDLAAEIEKEIKR